MQAETLTGIARMAAGGVSLGKKRQVEYRSLPSRSILNRCANPRMPFRWTVNPYRGCEIGCHYCYAAYTHKYLGIEDPSLFDSLIYSKNQAREILQRELERGVEGAIAVGTGTDPYQPAERRFETTRGILEAFAEASGNEIGITTKSDLILRDIDLLGKIAASNDLHVNVTITTMDAALARALEPRAAHPLKRIDAVRELRWRGIEAGVLSAPVLPLLTDTTEILDAVARSSKRANATYWNAHALFLQPAARQRLMPFLRRQFPHLVARYTNHYKKGAYVSPGYSDWLAAKVDRIRRQHGLPDRTPEDSRKEVGAVVRIPADQLGLFDQACR